MPSWISGGFSSKFFFSDSLTDQEKNLYNLRSLEQSLEQQQDDKPNDAVTTLGKRSFLDIVLSGLFHFFIKSNEMSFWHPMNLFWILFSDPTRIRLHINNFTFCLKNENSSSNSFLIILWKLLLSLGPPLIKPFQVLSLS